MISSPSSILLDIYILAQCTLGRLPNINGRPPRSQEAVSQGSNVHIKWPQQSSPCHEFPFCHDVLTSSKRIIPLHHRQSFCRPSNLCRGHAHSGWPHWEHHITWHIISGYLELVSVTDGNPDGPCPSSGPTCSFPLGLREDSLCHRKVTSHGLILQPTTVPVCGSVILWPFSSAIMISSRRITPLLHTS